MKGNAAVGQELTADRLWDRTDRRAGCWVYAGGVRRDGYGWLRFRGRAWLAHRVAWTLTNGPIADGLVIDHICRVRSCINPDHLRVVTRRVNTLENSLGTAARNARKTICKRGHEFTPENTQPQRNGRRCRACLRAYRAARRGRP